MIKPADVLARMPHAEAIQVLEKKLDACEEELAKVNEKADALNAALERKRAAAEEVILAVDDYTDRSPAAEPRALAALQRGTRT